MKGMRMENDKQRNTEDSEPAAAPASPMVFKYFLVFFLISFLALGRLLWPFVSILVLSFLLAGIFRPIYNYLTRRFSPSFSSLATCVLIIVLVFVPLLFLVGALSQEALGLYQTIKGTNWGLRLREIIHSHPIILQTQDLLAGYGLELSPESISKNLSDFSRGVGFFLYNQASSWAANIVQFIYSFFMMIIVIFFLLIDHDRLIGFLLKISPLPDEQERRLIRKFEEIAGAVLIGNGICGLIQGVLGGLVFALFNLGQPILWGGMMAVLAFLPILGIGLVLVPAALLLFIKGKAGLAVFMLIFYASLSFSVEYLLKPKLVGDRVKLHTLLVFLAILGGLSVFGVLGIIFGPLIVTAFITLADIYLENYDRYVKTGEW